MENEQVEQVHWEVQRSLDPNTLPGTPSTPQPPGRVQAPSEVKRELLSSI